jgi:hypothetical protein
MNIENLTSTQLRHAADLKEKIADLEKQLAGIIFVGGKPHVPVKVSNLARKKRGMSAAGRARIAAAQKLRWAKINAGKTKSAAPKPAKRRKMSAAGRAAIAAAARARWAKAKAAGKTSL